MAAQPGSSAAVPGAIWPGAAQPGKAGTPAVPGADVTFTLGIPSFRWAAGSPLWPWETGVPYGV